MSDEPITDAELAEWKALADAATPGPWKHVTGEDAEPMWDVCICGSGNDGVDHAIYADSDKPELTSADADAAFIAAARTALPRLLARERDNGLQLEQARELLAEVRQFMPDDFDWQLALNARVDAFLSAQPATDRAIVRLK